MFVFWTPQTKKNQDEKTSKDLVCCLDSTSWHSLQRFVVPNSAIASPHSPFCPETETHPLFKAQMTGSKSCLFLLFVFVVCFDFCLQKNKKIANSRVEVEKWHTLKLWGPLIPQDESAHFSRSPTSFFISSIWTLLCCSPIVPDSVVWLSGKKSGGDQIDKKTHVAIDKNTFTSRAESSADWSFSFSRLSSSMSSPRTWTINPFNCRTSSRACSITSCMWGYSACLKKTKQKTTKQKPHMHTLSIKSDEALIQVIFPSQSVRCWLWFGFLVHWKLLSSSPFPKHSLAATQQNNQPKWSLGQFQKTNLVYLQELRLQSSIFTLHLFYF